MDAHGDPGRPVGPVAGSGSDEVRFRASMERGSGRRSRSLLAGGVAPAAIIVVGIGVFGPAPDGRPAMDLSDLFRIGSPSPDPPPPTPRPSSRPPAPRPTALPRLTIFDPGAPVSAIQVFDHPPGILDPPTSTRGTDVSWSA